MLDLPGLRSSLSLALGFGGTSCGPASCLGGSGAVVEGPSKGGTSCWLEAGERRGIPEGLSRSRVVCGVDFDDTWGPTESACVLLGDGGEVLGVVGPRALSCVDGVSLDYVNGNRIISFCAAELNRDVCGLFFIATPGARLSRSQSTSDPTVLAPGSPGQAADHVGTGVAYVTCAPGPDPGDSSEELVPLRVCFRLPPSKPGVAVGTLAFYSNTACGRLLHMEAVGEAFDFREKRSAEHFVAALEAKIARHAKRNLGLEQKQMTLAMIPVETMTLAEQCIPPSAHGRGSDELDVKKVFEAIARMNHVAQDKCRRAQDSRRQAVELQRGLDRAREYHCRVCETVDTIYYKLEAWRWAALGSAQAGQSTPVMTMLEELPSLIQFEDMLTAVTNQSAARSKSPREGEGGGPGASGDKEDASYWHTLGDFMYRAEAAPSGAPAGDPARKSTEPVPEEIKALQRELRDKERTYGPNHLEVALALTTLANAQGRRGDCRQQREALERAYYIFEGEYGLSHPETARRLQELQALTDRVDALKGSAVGKPGAADRSIPITYKRPGGKPWWSQPFSCSSLGSVDSGAILASFQGLCDDVSCPMSCDERPDAYNLQPGDRRWVPEAVYISHLVCGFAPGNAWGGHVEPACVLLNEHGTVLGMVGPRGLVRADGISLDYVGGCDVFSFCLARLNHNVRSILFIALPRDAEMEEPELLDGAIQPHRTAHPSLVYVAHAGACDSLEQTPLSRALCRVQVQLPPRRADTAVILLGFHSGVEQAEPFHLEAIGKPVFLDVGANSCGLASQIERIWKMVRRHGHSVEHRPQGEVPTEPETDAPRPASGGGADGQDEGLQEASAAASRLAKGKSLEAERECRNTADLNQLIGEMKESTDTVISNAHAIFSKIEAWRWEALFWIKAGEDAQVVAMLDLFPSPLQLKNVPGAADAAQPAELPILCPPPNKEGSLEDWKAAQQPGRGGAEASAAGHGHSPRGGQRQSPRGGQRRQHHGGEPDYAAGPSGHTAGQAEGRMPEEHARSSPPGSARGTSSGGSTERYRMEQEHLEYVLRIKERECGGNDVEVARILSQLASIHGKLGNVKQQKEHLVRALSIFENEYGSEHVEVGAVLVNLGVACGKLGDSKRRRKCLERALRIGERHYGAGSKNVAVMRALLNNEHGNPEDPHSQIEIQKEVLRALEQGPDANDLAVASALTNLAKAYGAVGDAQNQVEALERVLEIKERSLGPDHPSLAATLTNLGSSLGGLGDRERQLQYLERALQIREKEHGPDHPTLTVTLVNLGIAHKQMGDSQGALGHFERALRIKDRARGPEDFQFALTLASIGEIQKELGQIARHKENMERALAIFETELGPDHPYVAHVQKALNDTSEGDTDH